MWQCARNVTESVFKDEKSFTCKSCIEEQKPTWTPTAIRYEGCVRYSTGAWPRQYKTGCYPPPPQIPAPAQQVTNKCLCGRFTGKFWAIHPIVLTLPRQIICFGRSRRTWLVADSTTSSQWKTAFRDCLRMKTTDFSDDGIWTHVKMDRSINMLWKYA